MLNQIHALEEEIIRIEEQIARLTVEKRRLGDILGDKIAQQFERECSERGHGLSVTTANGYGAFCQDCGATVG
jgi:predicted  nucleic acid-binding Zn-ribbon protein